MRKATSTKAESTKAESTTAESVIRPKQLARLGMDILGKSKTYVVTRSKSKQNEEIENEMVECEVHSQDLNEDVDLIDFSEPDEEIQEDIDIEDVNELPEQGESIRLEHLIR